MTGQALRFVVTFSTQVYLARLLDPAQFGLIAMVAPVLGFVQVFTDLGLLQAVVQKAEVSQRQLSTVFWINAGFSLLLSLLFAASAPLLAWMYHEPRVMAVTVVLSSLIFITGLSQLQSALMNRHLRFVPMAVFEVVALTVGAVCGIGSAMAGAGYWALVLSQVAASVTSALLLWCYAGWRPSRPERDPEVVSMLKFGGHITGANLAGYLNVSIDNMMIGVVIGDVGLGIYDRAWKLAVQPLSQLTAPVDRLALPVLARLQAEHDRYRAVYVQMLQLLCLVATPGLLFALVMAEPLILSLFGDKWAATIPVFVWIGLGALITPLNIGAFWLFTSQGRGKQQMSFTIVVAVINILAYASGLPWGPVGVARASALSVYALQCPLLIWAATKEGPVGLGLVVRAITPFIVALAVTAAVLEALSCFRFDSMLLTLGCFLALAYACTFAVLGCVPSGRRLLGTVWNLRSAFRRQG